MKCLSCYDWVFVFMTKKKVHENLVTYRMGCCTDTAEFWWWSNFFRLFVCLCEQWKKKNKRRRWGMEAFAFLKSLMLFCDVQKLNSSWEWINNDLIDMVLCTYQTHNMTIFNRTNFTRMNQQVCFCFVLSLSLSSSICGKMACKTKGVNDSFHWLQNSMDNK